MIVDKNRKSFTRKPREEMLLPVYQMRNTSNRICRFTLTDRGGALGACSAGAACAKREICAVGKALFAHRRSIGESLLAVSVEEI